MENICGWITEEAGKHAFIQRLFVYQPQAVLTFFATQTPAFDVFRLEEGKDCWTSK